MTPEMGEPVSLQRTDSGRQWWGSVDSLQKDEQSPPPGLLPERRTRSEVRESFSNDMASLKSE
jgi:hypothetical protein